MTTQMELTARKYREIMADIKAMEEMAATLKTEMIAGMDELQADELQAGEYTIRYKLYESRRLDTTRLKAEHEEYLKLASAQKRISITEYINGLIDADKEIKPIWDTWDI